MIKLVWMSSQVNHKFRDHEFLYSPLFGLLPIILVFVLEPFLGLNIALHYAIMLSPLVLLKNYFHKEYSNQPIVIYYLFVFAAYQYISSHVYIIPDGHILEIFIFHGLMIVSISSTFFFRRYLFKFFSRYFAGSSMHLERNLKEFYLLSAGLLVFIILHYIVYIHSIYTPKKINVEFHEYFDMASVFLIILLIIFDIFRIRRITKLFKLEDFWPIVNKDGVVIGKVARSITLRKSNYSKEMHPVVHVHVLNGESILMFRSEAHDSDGKWVSAISEHVNYGEKMDQTIKRVAIGRYGLKDFKPNFLLKHLVEKELEKQYVLLYYISQKEELNLVHKDEGQIKYWPTWQIEENLGKGVFSEAFEIEYEYLKNTVLVAEQFAKLAGEED